MRRGLVLLAACADGPDSAEPDSCPERTEVAAIAAFELSLETFVAEHQACEAPDGCALVGAGILGEAVSISAEDDFYALVEDLRLAIPCAAEHKWPEVSGQAASCSEGGDPVGTCAVVPWATAEF